MLIPTRTIGKILRTKATRPQVTGAWILGCLLGFLPGFFLPTDLGGGFAQAPGLILASILVALVFKVHLGMFGLAVMLSKLASIPLLPVTHTLGSTLVDGLEPVFRLLRDTPLVAWCGPERYATVGGLFVGLVTGFVSGLVAWRLLQQARRTFAKIESNQRLEKIRDKKWANWLSWIAFGGDKGSRSWQQLADAKQPFLPGLRWQGLAVAAVLLAVGLFAQSQLAGSSLRDSTQHALQRTAGATVDLDSASVGLLSGDVSIRKLAIADRENLGKDLFRADELRLDVDTYALSQRRFVVDQLTASGAAAGVTRTAPAERIDPPEPPAEPEPVEPDGPEEKTLEDWIEEAETWKNRLEQVASWVQYFASGEGEETAEEVEAEDRGFFGFATDYSRPIGDRFPAILIRSVNIDGIASDWLGESDLFDLTATNLSSHPDRVEAPMELRLQSRSGRFSIALRRESGQENAIVTDLVFDGLPVDSTLAALGLSKAPLSGGTMRIQLGGNLDLSGSRTRLDLPLGITTTGTSLTLPSTAPMSLDGLPLVLGLRGSLGAPLVRFDADPLYQALIAKGRTEIAGALKREAGRLLDGAVPAPLVEGLQKALDGDAREVIQDAAEKAKAEALKAAEEQKKKAEEELKKKALEKVRKGLGGLIPGGGGDKDKDG